MSAGFEFEGEHFTDEELYRRIGFIGVPSDRELEARIVVLLRKYHKSGNPDLYDFFDAVYDYFFEVDAEDDGAAAAAEEGFADMGTAAPVPAPPAPPTAGGGAGAEAVGTIVKPPEKASATYLSNPVQYSKDNNLNPILKQTISRLVSIDSSYRDINASNSTTNAISTNFVIDLNDPLKDVLSLKLYSYQIPFTWYTISKDFGSNFFILQGVSPGLLDTDTFDYKYDISAGNYSAQELVDTINTRMRQVASANTDVSFGSTALVYNKYNTTATFNVEMTNIYGEPNYYLDWVATSAVNRDSYIGSYLGFRESAYGIYSVYSNEDSLPPIAATATTDAFSSIYYLANRSDFSNNYFQVVHYYNALETDANGVSYVPRYVPGVSQVLDTFLVQSSLTTGKYTRNAIYADIDAQLQANGFLSGEAGIVRVDRTDASYSFFRMDLPLNRSTTANVANSKVAVVFPSEPAVDFSGGTFPIWTGLTSCFLFDPSFVETSDIVSENSLNLSNYLIVNTPVLDLSCNVAGYDNSLNQALIQVAPAPNPSVGYTFSEYIAAINTGFDTLIASGSLNINSGIFVDVSNFANLDFDYNLSFVNADYTIDLSGGMQLLNFGPVFTSVADLGAVSTFTNTLPVRTSYSIQVDGSGNPIYPLFRVLPKSGRGNENAGNFVVPFLPANGVLDLLGGLYVYNSYLGFVTDYNNSMNFFADAYGSQVLVGSSFAIAPGGSGYTMTLQMNVFKGITQNGFNLALYDLSGGSTQVFGPDSSWYVYLHFQSREYVLSSAVQSPPSSVVVADLPIVDTTGTITLVDGSNNYFYFRPQSWADGLFTRTAGAVRGSAYNDVRVVVPAGTYTTLQLFTAMNAAFNANPVMQGTYVDALNVGGVSYTRLRVNLNKVFTAADYELVFYDLLNFVQCYVGSSSVRNTTWDTTLGWILGFQAQTSYSLAGFSGVATLSGESSVNVNLYSYFLISLEDYNQSRINDGLVTITKSENYTPLPSYSAIANFTCDLGGNAISTGSTVVAQNNLTLNQVYAINQSLASQQPVSKAFSQGPYVKDLFAMIPIKTAGLQNGQLLTEFGGSLQNLTRFYYGPVNIRRLQVQLYNNQGQIMDLNGSDWSFSFICEQLYQKNKI